MITIIQQYTNDKIHKIRTGTAIAAVENVFFQQPILLFVVEIRLSISVLFSTKANHLYYMYIYDLALSTRFAHKLYYTIYMYIKYTPKQNQQYATRYNNNEFRLLSILLLFLLLFLLFYCSLVVLRMV